MHSNLYSIISIHVKTCPQICVTIIHVYKMHINLVSKQSRHLLNLYSIKIIRV